MHEQTQTYTRDPAKLGLALPFHCPRCGRLVVAGDLVMVEVTTSAFELDVSALNADLIARGFPPVPRAGGEMVYTTALCIDCAPAAEQVH